MTAFRQDFTTFQSDSISPIVLVSATNGNPLDISAVSNIVWNVQRSLSDSIVVSKSKTGGGIVFTTDGTDGQFTINLTATDTASLSGYYFHEAYLLDSSNNQFTVLIGRLKVGPDTAWTYDPSSLLIEPKYQVRWLIGDTDRKNPQLDDFEIVFALQFRGNLYSAAAFCAQALAGKYSRLVNQSADGVSQQSGMKATQYATLSKEYEQKAGIYCIPYAGALSKADMLTVISNPDRIPDMFRFGMFDNPPNAGVSPPTASGGGNYFGPGEFN